MGESGYQIMSTGIKAIGVSLGWIGVLAPAVAQDSFPPPWRGQPETTYQAWSFDDNDDPAAPEGVTNPYGIPLADITIGTFGSGWLYELPGLGTMTGFWDIGGAGISGPVNGRIDIAVANSATPRQYKEIRVQVTYFRDITQPPAISVPGAVHFGQAEALVQEIPTGGAWYTLLSKWWIRPNPASEQIQITADPVWGAIVDAIVVDTRCTDCNEPGQDTDEDGDVDVNDFAVFQACFNGPNNPWPPGGPPACLCLDEDADGDVDVNDFAVFQACFNGPDRPPACAG